LSQDTPTASFAGQLTVDDFKRCMAFPVDVPPGTTRMHVDLRFEPLRVAGIKNKITIALHEPDGTFRGVCIGGSDHKVFDVGLGGAETGFFPGPLPPGRWTVELDTHMIVPGSTISYSLGVWLSSESQVEVRPRLRFPRPACRQGPDWYRGDLHVHTDHSDGHRSVAQLLDTIRQHKLDFVALTEHNNVTQLYDPALDGANDVAIIPGLELTTYYGHALSLGTTEWIDWRMGHDGRTMQDAADEIHARGGLLVAAHMSNTGDPFCTGCTWLFDRFMPGDLDAVEVWNSPWSWPGNNNGASLRIWYGWLNAGHRIPATAGSDAHGPYRKDPGFNLIWAEELSARGLLEGLRRGHVMLSSGPRLWIEAPRPDGSVVMMGDSLPVAGHQVPVTVRWAGAPRGATARLIVDGYIEAEWDAAEDGERSADLLALRWVLAELRNAQGDMLALTNPIYLERDLRL